MSEGLIHDQLMSQRGIPSLRSIRRGEIEEVGGRGERKVSDTVQSFLVGAAFSSACSRFLPHIHIPKSINGKLVNLTLLINMYKLWFMQNLY